MNDKIFVLVICIKAINIMESIFNSSDHEVITEKQLEFDLYQEFFSNGAAPNGPNAGQTEVNPDPFMTLQPQNLTFSEDEAQNNIDFILWDVEKFSKHREKKS